MIPEDREFDPPTPPQLEPMPMPASIHTGFLMALNVWWAIRALLGIGFVIGLVRCLDGSIWLGVTIGCAIAFVAAYSEDGGGNG